MTDEERNELLDRVVGMGTGVAVPWLRSAFHVLNDPDAG